MNSTTTPQAETLPRAKNSATNRQIRGSSLMLVGRALSMGVNFVVQVLIVRYFANAKGDYGAFAYALSIVTLGESIATFGLDRAVTRFLPIYHERQEYNKLFGTIFLVVGTIVFCGFLPLVALFVGAFDTRVHDEEDVERLGLPILGHLPAFPGDGVGSLRSRGVRGRRVPS